MTYYIRCPKCGEMIEASYKPAYHVCYECGHKYMVTANNSMKKPPVYLITIVGVFLMFVASSYVNLVYCYGYPCECLWYSIWYLLGGGALAIASIWIQNYIERRVRKYGVKRMHQGIAHARPGDSKGPIQQNARVRYDRRRD